MATTTKKTTTRTPRAGKAAVRKPNRSNIVPAPPFVTKTEHVIGMLRRKHGASLAEIMDVLGWLQHSVRALLSARIAKELKLPLVKNRRPGEETRYHIGALRSGKE
jgi:hypothetical protein